MKNVNLWSTWDHGTPWMYTCEAALLKGKEAAQHKGIRFCLPKDGDRTDGRSYTLLDQ